MSKKILITGVTGQDGSNMVDYLLKHTDDTVVGGVRRLSVKNHENIEHLKDEPRFKLIDLDVTDQINTNLIIQEEEPDYFINFAANSFVGTSWKMPVQHMMNNAMPVMYQLEAIRRHAPDCRYYNAGSSEQFGDVKYSPQDIAHPFRPRSPYGISKCSAHHMVKVWRESYGIYAVQGLLFNHEGVRRGEEFVTRKISKAVARIRHQLDRGVPITPLELGNLGVKRDWSDSMDFMDGIWRMLNQDKSFSSAHGCEEAYTVGRVYEFDNRHAKDYVLASDETHTIREFVELSFKELGIEGKWHGKGQKETFRVTRTGITDTFVKVNPEFWRPNEVELLWGDSIPAREDLNWQPLLDFQGLVSKMVQHDHNEIKRQGL
jgi:GDPmannose 4,6-dehydratase